MRATAIYRPLFLNIEHAAADPIGRFFCKKKAEDLMIFGVMFLWRRQEDLNLRPTA